MATFILHTSPDATRTIECVQADPFIEISDQVLEHADPAFVDQGDGIVTFHCADGDLTYGLKQHDEFRECWLAVRAGFEDEDE